MKKPEHTDGSDSLVNSHNIQKNPLLNMCQIISSIIWQTLFQSSSSGMKYYHTIKRGREEKESMLRNVSSTSKYSKDETES